MASCRKKLARAHKPEARSQKSQGNADPIENQIEAVGAVGAVRSGCMMIAQATHKRTANSQLAAHSTQLPAPGS